MGRSRNAEESVVVSIRLSQDMIRRLDIFADELRVVAPGVNITRTDAVRAILKRTLSGSPAEVASVPKSGCEV